MDQLICEVFDSESSRNYPTVNLSVKDKVPQLWGFHLPGNDQLVARLVSYASKGDAIKKVKPGDKYAHVILMSLSKNGTPAELRGGLGSDPVGALNTIFDAVYDTILKTKMDAVLFRFPAKKMKGQEKTLQRIMSRLVMQRSGGKFTVVDELYNYTAKHAYILIKRKSVALESIKDIPDIDHEEYTKVDSKVGEVYIKKSTGEKVTKTEAIASAIASVEEKRTDRSVISRTKIDRKDLTFFLYSGEEEHREYLETEVFKKSVESAGDAIHSSKGLEDFGPVAKLNKFSRLVDYSPASYVNISFELNEDYKIISYLSGNMFSVDKEINDTARRVNTRLKELVLNEISKPHNNSLDLLMSVSSRVEMEYSDLTENNKILGNTDTKEKIKQYVVGVVANDIYSYNQRIVETIPANSDFDYNEAKAISRYCSNDYVYMNNALLGKQGMDEASYDKYILKMDSAFSKGTKLPKGTVLYRGGILGADLFKRMIERRVAYFPNFVSTSLSPIIVKKGHVDSLVSKEESDEVIVNEKSNNIIVSYIIYGADKIKTIVPGKLSIFPGEAEVILPRGSIFKIKNYYRCTTSSNNKYLIECELDTNEVIEESKPNGIFSGFINESFKSDVANVIYWKEMQVITDLAATVDLPEKFVI
ncbi:Alt-like RNA polymerase ADP-ribosyltransferase [Pseudomonas phage PspYZU05]|uniref:NAD(+)--arginine ADP-ribosyltransferase n=1 Tax=Pseudomonas phage PspYZU05 TaxID=1983556 RepID=A0A2U7N2J6_9CAUD|nr:Alt-like RNA polymerase ADP-ribosyltransferase [Pseudomonas phage PspYZU05]ASD52110.1 RNA polymerase ADP-ribosylase [Pseudomonas phage PspYZU05]